MNKQNRGDDQPYERRQNRERKDSPQLTIAILSVCEERLPNPKSVSSIECEKVGPMCVVGAQAGMDRREEIADEGCDSKRRGNSRIQSTTFSCEREHAIEQIVAKTGCDARYEAYESDRLVERAKDDAQAYVSRLLMSEGCLLGLMADVVARKVLVDMALQ
jgi:hypothetical protein